MKKVKIMILGEIQNYYKKEYHYFDEIVMDFPHTLRNIIFKVLKPKDEAEPKNEAKPKHD